MPGAPFELRLSDFTRRIRGCERGDQFRDGRRVGGVVTAVRLYLSRRAAPEEEGAGDEV